MHRRRVWLASCPKSASCSPLTIPALSIDQTLAELGGFVAGLEDAWELVFVCDGCTDGTVEKIRRWKPKAGTVRLVDYATNRGKGYALRQGLIAASGRAPHLHRH